MTKERGFVAGKINALKIVNTKASSVGATEPRLESVCIAENCRGKITPQTQWLDEP